MWDLSFEIEDFVSEFCLKLAQFVMIVSFQRSRVLRVGLIYVRGLLETGCLQPM